MYISVYIYVWLRVYASKRKYQNKNKLLACGMQYCTPETITTVAVYTIEFVAK